MNDRTDRADSTDVADATPGSSSTSPSATGDPVVDEVLGSLEDLESRPLSEHVGVFEAAHERLRGALSEAGDTAHEPRRG